VDVPIVAAHRVREIERTVHLPGSVEGEVQPEIGVDTGDTFGMPRSPERT